MPPEGDSEEQYGQGECEPEHRMAEQMAEASRNRNRIDPYALNELDQRMLKESFRQARDLQRRLQQTFGQ